MSAVCLQFAINNSVHISVATTITAQYARMHGSIIEYQWFPVSVSVTLMGYSPSSPHLTSLVLFLNYSALNINQLVRFDDYTTRKRYYYIKPLYVILIGSLRARCPRRDNDIDVYDDVDPIRCERDVTRHSIHNFTSRCTVQW